MIRRRRTIWAFRWALATTMGAAPHAQGIPLKVLSYNAFLFRFDAVSDATASARIRLMPAAIAATGADLVLLQEV